MRGKSLLGLVVNVEFVMPRLMKYLIKEEFCMRVKVIDECVRDVNLNKEILDKSLESEVDPLTRSHFC